eukprot:1349039-Pleurochrysis_carterae.AAC.3
MSRRKDYRARLLSHVFDHFRHGARPPSPAFGVIVTVTMHITVTVSIARKHFGCLRGKGAPPGSLRRLPRLERRRGRRRRLRRRRWRRHFLLHAEDVPDSLGNVLLDAEACVLQLERTGDGTEEVGRIGDGADVAAELAVGLANPTEKRVGQLEHGALAGRRRLDGHF